SQARPRAVERWRHESRRRNGHLPGACAGGIIGTVWTGTGRPWRRAAAAAAVAAAVVAAGAAAASCAHAPTRTARAPGAAPTVRVMTYNVNFGIPGDGP